MAIERKTTGTEGFHTYKDGFGTLEEPSKMVTKSIRLTSFGSYVTQPNSAELTTDIGNRSCLIHTMDIMNVSAGTDVYFEIYDHAWGRYGSTGYTRYNCSDGQSDQSAGLLATSDVGDGDMVSNGGLDATLSSISVVVGDLLSIENDGDEGTGAWTTPSNQQIESVVADTITANPTVRRGMGGTQVGEFRDNFLVMAGRNRFKGIVLQPAKSNSHQRFTFPIPLLVEGGWRCRAHTSAGASSSSLIVNITYSVLEHVAQRDQSTLGGGSDASYVGPSHDYLGELQDANYRYLKCAWHSGDASNSYNQDHWLATDVEVYGAICTSDASSDYRGYQIKNGDNTTKQQIWDYAFSHSADPIATNHGPVVEPQWFPYPVFLKKGIKTQSTGGTSGYASILYRPVKSYNTSANDTMI